ncbi:MAG: RCC1 repeat-containing protein, partial [Myxococcota bacterium]|nr:RCC1 repeat-containing protein [Myxococcota bacterium]
MPVPARAPAGEPRPRWLGFWGLASFALLTLFPASGWAEIAGGLGHTCSVSILGEVQCWGFNDAGQLGDGTTTARAYPAPVSGLGASPIISVGTGEAFSCALNGLGEMLCWGDNSQGQLGDGTRNSSLVPILVGGLGGTVESFSPGRQHVCAALTNGNAECWGDNSTGQLGDGNFFDRLVPTLISGLGGLIASVASGYDHTCAVTILGDAYCWGNNFFGQLGDGTFVEKLIPVPVDGLTGTGIRIAFADEAAAGEFHSCIRTPAGDAYCWGDNISGQVGNAVLATPHTAPVAVAGLGGPIQQIEAGKAFTCALLSSGGVQCWGENMDGQLGDGSTIDRFSPAGVTGLSIGVTAIGLGDLH